MRPLEGRRRFPTSHHKSERDWRAHSGPPALAPSCRICVASGPPASRAREALTKTPHTIIPGHLASAGLMAGRARRRPQSPRRRDSRRRDADLAGGSTPRHRGPGGQRSTRPPANAAHWILTVAMFDTCHPPPHRRLPRPCRPGLEGSDVHLVEALVLALRTGILHRAPADPRRTA